MTLSYPTPAQAKTNTIRRQTKPCRRIAALLLASLAAALCHSAAYGQTGEAACGRLTNGYGPYDYRTDKKKLDVVTGAHFTPEVENLVRGTTSTRGPEGDINYTLRAIPNHPRALNAMMRLEEKYKLQGRKLGGWPVECYFDRALRFRPDDTIVRMLYATFLAKNARIDDAGTQLEQVTALTKDNPAAAFTHYNVGLIYFDMKVYDKALDQARKAIALGFPETALRKQLESVGKWTDAPGSPATAPKTVPGK